MSKIGTNMTETEYVLFKEKLRGVIFKVIVGVVIGLIAASALATSTFERVGCVLLFACIPYTWCMIPFVATGLYGFIFKAFISIVGGIIITPISLIYNLVMVHAYEKAHGQGSAPRGQRPDTDNAYDAPFVEESNGTDDAA